MSGPRPRLLKAYRIVKRKFAGTAFSGEGAGYTAAAGILPGSLSFTPRARLRLRYWSGGRI